MARTPASGSQPAVRHPDRRLTLRDGGWREKRDVLTPTLVLEPPQAGVLHSFISCICTSRWGNERCPGLAGFPHLQVGHRNISLPPL